MECPTCNGAFNIGDSYTLDGEGNPVRCIHLHFVEPQPDPEIIALINAIFDI